MVTCWCGIFMVCKELTLLSIDRDRTANNISIKLHKIAATTPIINRRNTPSTLATSNARAPPSSLVSYFIRKGINNFLTIFWCGFIFTFRTRGAKLLLNNIESIIANFELLILVLVHKQTNFVCYLHWQKRFFDTAAVGNFF